MASYTDKKITTVEEIIDKFTQDTLDNYVRATVKSAAKSYYIKIYICNDILKNSKNYTNI